MAARKRRTTRRRASTVHHRVNPVRRTRRASTRRVTRTHVSHARRRNPLFAHKRRRSVARRNPFGGGIIGEALPLVGASVAISFVAPIATRLVGGFLPLGQFTQPVVLAGTGYGLGWVAGKLGFAKYKKPLEIAGAMLGITALVTPYLRGLMAPSAPAHQQPQGMGYLRRGLNGIAVVPTIPPQLRAGTPAHTMAGIGQGMPGSFGGAMR